MTHRTRDEWEEVTSTTMTLFQARHALRDLAELFAKVEALETENAALKAQVAERDDVIANYLDTFGLPPEVIKIHLEALERVFPCPNLKKEPDNG